MIVDTSVQLWVFFVCMFLGGIIYFAYKITHPVLAKNKILLHLQDVVFCIVAFFVIWRGLLFANCGQIRLFCIVGIALGFVAGAKTVGVCVDKFVLKLYNFFIKSKQEENDG